MIIPLDRRYPWEGGVTIGVPGGIPNRTSIFVNLQSAGPYHCAADGVTNDAPTIQQALIDCPDDQVVYAPEGRYRLASNIVTNYQQKKFSLRGDGMGKTVFVPENPMTVCFRNGGGGNPEGWTGISAGTERGSTQITIPDTRGTENGGPLPYSGIHVGRPILILPGDVSRYPTFVHILNDTNVFQYNMGWTFIVTAKTTTTIDFWPPLPFDLTDFGATVAFFPVGSLYPLIDGIGYEKFTVDCSAMSAGAVFELYTAMGCWYSEIETIAAPVKQNVWEQVLFSEVRRCYFHDCQGGGSGHEGFAFSGMCNWNWIEDTICKTAGFPNIVDSDAGTFGGGNVVSHNFCIDVNVGAPDTMGADIGFNHGSGTCFDLMEGNILGMFQVDGYHGSCSHGTAYRNWAHLLHPTATQGRRGFDACHYSAFMNVVGNIFGDSTFTGSFDLSTTRNYSNGIPVIRRLGAPNLGNTCFGIYGDGGDPSNACTTNVSSPCRDVLPATNPPNYTGESYILGSCGVDPYSSNAQRLDKNVAASIIWANYDYSHNDTIWENATPEAFPDSMLRASPPDWWPSGWAWPLIGPDKTLPGAANSTTMSARLPAAYAYFHKDEDGIPQWPASGDPEAPANTVLPGVSGTAIEGATLTGTLGSWTGNPTPTFVRAWLRCDAGGGSPVVISGATASTYVLQSADIGHTIRERVTATNTEGVTVADSAATGVIAADSSDPPANTVLPVVTGTPINGQTLTGTLGTWTGEPTPTLVRAWLRCDVDGLNPVVISGATSSTYVLQSADIGHTIRERVTGTNTEGSVAVSSAATEVITEAGAVVPPVMLSRGVRIRR